MSSTGCIKVVTYVVDIICALLALVLIGFGIYLFTSYDLNEFVIGAAGAYIGIGVMAIIFFLWGFLAARKEHICCTMTFTTFLVAIIIVQGCIVYLLNASDSSIASNLANTLDNAWDKEADTPGAMSIYENWFHCCGRASPNDYIQLVRMPPDSCYPEHNKTLAANLITKGCRVEFEDYILSILKIFNVFAWILIGFEIFAVFVSCCLCNSIRNTTRRSYF